MVWLFAIVVIVVIAYFIFNFENGCAIVIGGIIVIIAIIGLLFVFVDAQHKKEQTEKKQISQNILPQILLYDSNVLQNYSYNSFKFTSAVKNDSTYNVRELEISFSIKDCISSNYVEQNAVCSLIGEYALTEYVNLPAGQVRYIDASIYFSDMPPIEGDWIVEYDVKFVGVTL